MTDKKYSIVAVLVLLALLLTSSGFAVDRVVVAEFVYGEC